MLFRKNAQMVDPADALTGRTDQTMPVPEAHFVNGHPLVGSPAFEAVFGARRARTRPMSVDGIERVAEASLAREITRCPIRERGVEL